MAKYFHMVQETGTGTGTGGNITLAGAVSGYRTINAAGAVTGDFVLATIVDGDGSGAFELTFCEVLSSTSLARTFVVESTNANAAIDLSANTHTITLAPAPPNLQTRLECIARLEDLYTITDTNNADLVYFSTLYDNTCGCTLANTDTSIVIPDWADIVNVTFRLQFSSGATVGGARINFGGTNLRSEQDYLANFPNIPDISTLYAGAFIQYHRASNAQASIECNVWNETGSTLTPSQAAGRVVVQVVG